MGEIVRFAAATLLWLVFGEPPAQAPLWARAVTGAVTCTLPGVSAGNWITASGASRWSSSIQAHAEWPATVA